MASHLTFKDEQSLQHLVPWARKIAALPNDERIQRVRNNRWIGYTKAEEALTKLENLFTHPTRHRMPNLLIIGPTNNGKTMIIEKFRRMHPPPQSENSDAEELPILVMQMPSDPSVSRFYSMLLHILNVPTRGRPRLSELESLTLKILQKIKVRLLVIDEVHNILAGSTSEQREFLNLIRFLGNQLKIPIVCVGTKDAYFAIRSDDQLENRFEPLTLPVWQDDAEFTSLLISFASTLPLRKPSKLDVPDLVRFILDKSEGTIGEITSLLTRAAIIAIESGDETINRKILALVDYESPTERRRRFERDFA